MLGVQRAAGVKGEDLYKGLLDQRRGVRLHEQPRLENNHRPEVEKTGSGIGTMHKDLTISLKGLAEELEVPSADGLDGDADLPRRKVEIPRMGTTGPAHG